MRQELINLLEEARKNLKNNTNKIKNNTIWMKFENIKTDIDKVAATKNPLVKEYIDIHKESEKNPISNIGRMAREMRRLVVKMESYTAAAEMCTNDADKKELLDARDKLLNDPAINKYEKYLEGLKYLAGATNEVSPEVEEFFREELVVPLQSKDSMYEKHRVGVDEYIKQEIEKLDKQEVEMNAKLPEIEKELQELDIKERAAGTMHKKLAEAFDKVAEAEKEREEFEKNKASMTKEEADKKDFQLRQKLNNSKSDVKIRSQMYGSPERKALIIEKSRLESAISNLPSKRKDLNELKLSPENQEKLDEYQKVKAPFTARDLFVKQALGHKKLTENFIGKYLDRADRVKGSQFGDRQTPGTMCIAMMLLKGYKIEDITNPSALLDVKKEIGEEYIRRREAKDVEWFAKTMYDGGFLMMDAFKKYIKDHKNELKTENDLTTHIGTLGLLAVTCFDVFQEIGHFKGVYKTAEECEFLIDKIGGYVCAAGAAAEKGVFYDDISFTADYIAGEMGRQIRTKMLLDEIQKDDPDIETATIPQYEAVASNAQLTTMPEFNAIYTKGSEVHFENLSKEDAKQLAYMQTMEFVQKNDIRLYRAKYPVKAKNSPESVFNKIEIGEQLPCVVSRGGKQLVATDIAVKVEKGFRSLFNKKIVAERSKNSDQFNTMLDEYKKALPNIKDNKKDIENIEALKDLKEAAKNYILAKRAQKGYESKEMLDNDVDHKMLGQKKGGRSIFTTRGKDRYEFAVKILTYVTGLEKCHDEYQKQQDHLEFVKNEQNEIKNLAQNDIKNVELNNMENDMVNEM